MNAVVEKTTAIPAIGQPWTEQGGLYIGARLKDGQVHHMIIPGGIEHDIKASHNNAAERIAAKGEINGFSDWRHGDQEDLMLAYINTRDQFHRKGIESIQISATPCGSFSAWCVVSRAASWASAPVAASFAFVLSADHQGCFYGFWLHVREAGAGLFRLSPE